MSRHILVVDDDDAIREVAELTLQVTADWQVSTASSGAEAIELAPELAPDVILMDVMMPGMDGPTAVLELRADPATTEIPVIMMTAKDLDPERRQALGLAGVIRKPFDPMALADEVSRILGWTR